jgi:hypothetical protein
MPTSEPLNLRVLPVNTNVIASSKAASKKKKAKSKVKTATFLEGMISRTDKFKVDDLLDLYKVYDHVVVDHVFRLLLFPYTRFARTWLRDQARDLLAETDRNRLILTSRARKAAEAAFTEMEPDSKARWTKAVKQKHGHFIVRALRMLHSFDVKGSAPSIEAIRGLGVSRLVFDDIGTYYTALMNRYPHHVADWCAAKADGDVDGMLEAEANMQCLEAEVGIRRDDAWYVTTNTLGYYALVEKMVNTVTMAYSRLLFRFAHQLRGVTSTEENFSAGYEGLIRAAKNYDPTDGSSFTAHCAWWIRSAVLQRQRQASIISLPSSTWHQLSLLQRGQTELSGERVSDLKERAEMFYANSANASRLAPDADDADDYSFESVRVTSPDAVAVMGDALGRSQRVEENYESANLTGIGRNVLEEVIRLLHVEDPSLLFPVLLWGLNSGIDATLLVETTAPLFLNEEHSKQEGERHKQVLARQQTITAIGRKAAKEKPKWQS